MKLVIRDITPEQHRAVVEALERLEAPQGLERSLVAPAAERAKRQGGVEDSREGKRVAPVEAQAALFRAIATLEYEAAKFNLDAQLARAERLPDHARYLQSRVSQNYSDVAILCALLPEPESDAYASKSPDFPESYTGAKP